MSEAEMRDVAREFGSDDALELARSIIESEAGRECCWSAAAIETVAAIILWEARKAESLLKAHARAHRRASAGEQRK